MLEVISFYLFSVLIIISFSIVVLSSNILYTMTALASGMIFISGIFFTLGAEFLGVVQISVYTGAVMALYAFGMMFFDNSKNVNEDTKHIKKISILSVGIAIMLVVIISLPRMIYIPYQNRVYGGNIEQIGMILFSKYILPFELAAIMLLVAMIAGIILVKKDKESL